MPGFSIIPYTGVGSIRFGMSQEEVEGFLGPPETSEFKPARCRTFDSRGSLQTIYTATGLERVVFRNADAVLVSDLDIYADRGRHTLEVLGRIDPPLDGGHGGWVCFPRSGISLNGFGKRKFKEGQVVMVFPSLSTLQIWNETA